MTRRERERERERRCRVYKETPGSRPGPRERVRDASACVRRHQAFALAPANPLLLSCAASYDVASDVCQAYREMCSLVHAGEEVRGLQVESEEGEHARSCEHDAGGPDVRVELQVGGDGART